MYLTEKTTWSNAYNVARSYVMCGRRGYLATVISTDEIERLFNAGKGSGWVGGTMLRKTDDTLIDGNSDYLVQQVFYKFHQMYRKMRMKVL